MKDEIVISVENVSKDFILPHQKNSTIKSSFTSLLNLNKKNIERQHALKDINFKIKKGEFFGIVGRNGSGKSTLLKILAGIYQPTSGAVHTHGKLVPFIELGVGFNPELTGRENVFLNGALLGFSKQQISGMYDDIVAFAEIERFMDQKLKNYSSGMQVRLAFSLAIRADADILLIDEVLAVGDEAFQRKCFEYFRQLKSAKKTVVFVTHDMSAVQQYCDRAILIEKSRIVYEGKPAIVSSRYSKMLTDEMRKNKPAQEKNNKKLSPSGEERWGDGIASWTSVGAEVNEHDTVQIIAEGRALEDIENPIFGFSIKDHKFVQLVGTNTVRMKKDIKPIKKGQQFTVTWSVPNIFNNGKHFIDCTIAHDSAINVADRWPEAVSFTVFRQYDNPYPIAPEGIVFNHSKQGLTKKK